MVKLTGADWISIAVVSVLLLGLMMLGQCSEAGAAMVAGPESAPIAQAIARDIQPRFEACDRAGQHVYGILGMATWEEPAYPGALADRDYRPRIRIWSIDVVLTLCGSVLPASTFQEQCRVVEQEFIFRTMPGLWPRLLAVSHPKPYP